LKNTHKKQEVERLYYELTRTKEILPQIALFTRIFGPQRPPRTQRNNIEDPDPSGVNKEKVLSKKPFSFERLPFALFLLSPVFCVLREESQGLNSVFLIFFKNIQKKASTFPHSETPLYRRAKYVRYGDVDKILAECVCPGVGRRV